LQTYCHCGACHRLFSGVTPFAVHRSADGEHGSCLDPATLTVLRLRDGVWRGAAELSPARIAILRAVT
jgi:hypothetical protein